MLNYNNARKTVELSMVSGSVPMLVGEAGIGKTAMMSHIAKENGMKLFVIETGLLKEGEIGGLPLAQAYTEEDYERILKSQGKYRINSVEEILDTNKDYNKCMILFNRQDLSDEQIDDLASRIAAYKKKARLAMNEHNAKYEQLKNEVRGQLPETRTVYAVFHLLAKLAEYCSNPNNKALLFLDEINRSENAVMQELMNIILNRTINGYDLPKNCYVVAAANPSASFYDFKDTEYQVNEFDPAQLSRLTVITMETSERDWLTWATSEGKNGRPNIEDEITEFIASQPELLIVTKRDGIDDVTPNPRAWERVSRTLNVIKENEKYTDSDLYNKIIGDIGTSAATSFITHLRERKNPLITPEEIFAGKFTDDKKDRITGESYPRKLTILNNCLRYLSIQVKSAKDAKKNPALIERFIELLDGDVTPRELMVTLMSTLANNKNYQKLNDVLCDNEKYLDIYVDAHKTAM